MAQDMFIKIGSLKGEGQDKEFPGWIDVLAWSLGGAQSGTAHQGGGMGGGKVALQDFSFTKFTDIVSPKLWGKMCTGEHYDTVEFKARKAEAHGFIHTLRDSRGRAGYDAYVGEREDRTTENVTLNFKKYKIKYNQQAKSGGLETSDDFSYDLSKNTES